MARTRAQRRRQTLYLSIALALTLVVLLFARDVSRSAHGSIGPRRSENRSFGALANVLIAQQNQLDFHLAYLLAHGQSLSRPVFAARLDQLRQQFALWTVEADQLRRPKLAHGVNDAIEQLTELRIGAYQSLLASVARSLTLPWPIPATSRAVSAPASTLFATSQAWAAKRFSLVAEPGLVHLDAFTTSSATAYLNVGLTRLVASPTLALARGVGITAVAVQPSPLPAPKGTLLMPPVTAIDVGVSVTNASYVLQPVALRVTLTSRAGRVQSQTMRVVLGPLRSFAFAPNLFTTTPSERATLVISLSGAPAAPQTTLRRVYQVTMSP